VEVNVYVAHIDAGVGSEFTVSDTAIAHLESVLLQGNAKVLATVV
jgi:hypothetical protein